MPANVIPQPGDQPPDIPPVTTPDVKQLAQGEDAGHQLSGMPAFWIKVFWASLIEGCKIVLTVLADVFDELAALLTGFFTAAQGQDTPGFNNLVAAVLSDTLGIEVSAEDLQNAQFEGGRVGAMNKVGADLFNTLGNEWISGTASADAGGGFAGLPGTEGQPLTPEQGVKAAQAFIGFALSFAVRQGNVAFLSSALPWEWLGGIREYGEMMAKNLGLGRLVRRALQPYIQTLISMPLQQALNKQYRPHIMDAKQLASAFIRQDIDHSDYVKRLALLGYTDADAEILIRDTYSRPSVKELMLLHETGNLGDSDLQKGLQSLGFNTSDIPALILSRQLEMVQSEDRDYAKILVEQLVAGVISEGEYQSQFSALRIPKLEADAVTRNANARRHHHIRELSLSFLKKAYMHASITLDEYLAGARDLGYEQDQLDMLEQELLVEQKESAAAAAKRAAKNTAKKTTTSKTPGTPLGG